MITVNGKEEYLEKSITLLEFLEQRQYRPERIAVEKNGEIIPKKMYAFYKREITNNFQQ